MAQCDFIILKADQRHKARNIKTYLEINKDNSDFVELLKQYRSVGLVSNPELDAIQKTAMTIGLNEYIEKIKNAQTQEFQVAKQILNSPALVDFLKLGKEFDQWATDLQATTNELIADAVNEWIEKHDTKQGSHAVYEARITSLENEITRLHALLEKALTK